MLPRLLLALLTVMTTSNFARAEEDPRCYEMRVYFAAPGKLEDLNKRFRDHTCALFEKHAIENIGYWEPLENPEQKLIFVLGYPSREARENSWKKFEADTDWKAAKNASEANGKLVDKAEVTFLSAVDFSPKIKPSAGAEKRVFELRTYTTTAGNLDRLMSRFREHTTKLFPKHGMTNVFYWKLMPDQKGADSTLTYVLAHQSKEAGDASFKSFRADPAWIAAKEASEKEGGGSLTIPDGVKSVYMKATDYSPTR